MVNQEILSTKRFSNKYRAVACGRDFLFRLASADLSLISYRREDLFTNWTLPAHYLLQVLFWAPSFSHRVCTCVPSRQSMGHNQAVLQAQYRHRAKPTTKNAIRSFKNEVPFSLKRLQFPCKPCFAMTVHKAQGQTFKTVGVDLSELCFSHGQMYVACSRTGSPESLYLMTHNGESRNVVYKEALQ